MSITAIGGGQEWLSEIGLRLDLVDRGPVVTWQRLAPDATCDSDGPFAIVASGGSVIEVPSADDEWSGFELLSDAAGDPGAVTVGTYEWDECNRLYIGRDGGGRSVSAVVWRHHSAWREAIPDGTPPAAVVAQEQHLADCLSGVVVVGDYGVCPPRPS